MTIRKEEQERLYASRTGNSLLVKGWMKSVFRLPTIRSKSVLQSGNGRYALTSSCVERAPDKLAGGSVHRAAD
jgi:hypothetical protein